MNETGGVAAGETGKTSALAKLILLQTAQKSQVRPVGLFCAGEDSGVDEWSAASNEIVNAEELTLTLPR